MIHSDTVTYHAPAVRLVLDTLGPDNVLYGSDAPPLTSLRPRAIQLICDLDIPEPQREKIFWKNAARLLKLPIADAKAA
jgi:predicted TIM-barrel fold metal-dependent hydrolase